MPEIAYTPPSEYNPRFKTEIDKISFLVGLATYGIRIIQSQEQIGGGAKQIYKVPTGKTLFIIHAYIDAQGISEGVEMYLNTNAALDHSLLSISAGNNQIVANFALPLIANSGDEIIFETHAVGNSAWAGIAGYEIPTSMMPLFV